MKNEHIELRAESCELRAKKVAVISRSDQSQYSVTVNSFSNLAPQRLSGKEETEPQRHEAAKKLQYSVAVDSLLTLAPQRLSGKEIIMFTAATQRRKESLKLLSHSSQLATLHLDCHPDPETSGERSATTEPNSNSKNLSGTGQPVQWNYRNCPGTSQILSWCLKNCPGTGQSLSLIQKKCFGEGQFPSGNEKNCSGTGHFPQGSAKNTSGSGKNASGNGKNASGRVNFHRGGSIPVGEGQSNPGINKTGHFALSYWLFAPQRLSGKEIKFTAETQSRKDAKKARSLQLATRSLKHPSPDGIGISPKGRVRSELRFLTFSLGLAACSLERNSTVKQHSKHPQRRDCIYNASALVHSNTGHEAGELAFRACELLLN